MASLHARVGAVLGVALLLSCTGADPATNGAGPSRFPGQVDLLTLGTFDSRAIAIAYANSESFRAELIRLKHDLEQARAAGDAARAAELEAFGPALQARLHRQGFSTAPVQDILAHIHDELPTLAQQAGVDVIVSKWDLAYAAPSARTVDVTDLLVAAFHPDEKGLRWAREIVATPPVPLEDGAASTDH